MVKACWRLDMVKACWSLYMIKDCWSLEMGKDCWTHVTPWVLRYPQCHFPLYRRTPQLAYCLKHPPQSPYTCILAHSYCKPTLHTAPNWELQCYTSNRHLSGQCRNEYGTAVPSSVRRLNPKETAVPSSGQRLTIPCTAAPSSASVSRNGRRR